MRITAVAIALLLFARAGSAQVPTYGNIYYGYSYYNTNLSSVDRANTNGWEGSLEGKVLPHVGIVADISGHYGSQNFAGSCTPGGGGICNFNENVSEYNTLFGP